MNAAAAGRKTEYQRLKKAAGSACGFFSLDIFKNTRRYIALAAPIRADGASAGAQTGCCLKRPLVNILRYNVRAEPYVDANSSSAFICACLARCSSSAMNGAEFAQVTALVFMLRLFFTFPIYVHNKDSRALRYLLVHFLGNPLSAQ